MSNSSITNCTDVGNFVVSRFPQFLYLQKEPTTSKLSSKSDTLKGDSGKKGDFPHDPLLDSVYTQLSPLNTEARQAPGGRWCRRGFSQWLVNYTRAILLRCVWVPGLHSPQPMILTKYNKLPLLVLPQAPSSLAHSLMCAALWQRSPQPLSRESQGREAV